LILLRALRAVLAGGQDFELLLVGDGPQRAEIKATIRTLGLAGRVTITGWATSEQVRRYINSARALVLPSFYEGLPVAAMEALALGRPVIATYVGGVPELVRDGLNGWLVPPGSVSALAQAIKEALAAPVEKLQRMGANGAQLVAERHNAAIEARKLTALFKQSIERAKAHSRVAGISPHTS